MSLERLAELSPGIRGLDLISREMGSHWRVLSLELEDVEPGASAWVSLTPAPSL